MWRSGKKRTYLDIAAGVSGNPASPHAEGRAAHDVLESARTAIARLVECKADDVLFTGSATEANALAILGVMRAARTAGIESPHALYWPGSHASIVENMKIAEREGAVIEAVPVKDCRIDCDALAKMLRPETVLLAIEAVDGETGVIWNTREVGRVLESARKRLPNFAPSDPVPSRQNFPIFSGPYLHVDASQAPWTEKLTRAHFGADTMTLDASKVSEARGIGCLIAPRALPLAPLYGGGPQERGLRPGSEAPELARAFAEGLTRAAGGREAFRAAAAAAREKLVTTIYGSVPNVVVNESAHGQVPNIVNISLPGRDTDYLVALLDEAGFAVSTKSACESDSPEGSRAVFALFDDNARASSTLRISWGPEVGERELAAFGEALARAIHFIDTSASA
jgi:cysteine desulfurase